MSILFFHGFEKMAIGGGPFAWTGTTTGAAISTGRRPSSKGYTPPPSQTGRPLVNISPTTQAAVGFSFTPSTYAGNSSCGVLGFYSSGLLADGIVYHHGTNRLYWGSLTVSGGYAALTTGVTYYIEASINRATGARVLKVDGVTVVNGTGSTGGSFDSVHVGYVADANNTAKGMYDDLYITSGEFLGDVCVEAFSPSADTATKDFVPLSGTSNYPQVADAAPDGDTSYVATSTVGARDLYDSGDTISGTPVAVHAVAVGAVMSKTDAGERGASTVIKSGATVAQGVAVGVPQGYAHVFDMWTADPATGAAWTKSGVEALSFGVECRS